MAPVAAVAPDRGRMRRKLAEYSQTRDLGLRDEIVEEAQGLAYSLAGRFVGRGEDRDDLNQVALLGLTRAIDRFDPERGIELTTFASVTILGDLKRHFRDHAWTVRPPRRVHDLYLRVQRTLEELTQRLGRSPTMAEMAAALGVTVEDVLEATEAGGLRHLPSIDAPSPGGDVGERSDLDRRFGMDDTDGSCFRPCSGAFPSASRSCCASASWTGCRRGRSPSAWA